MKEWIIDQLHIHPARLNQTGIIYHFGPESLPVSSDDSTKNNSKS